MLDSQTVEGFRVLVVDDNPAIHEDFRKVLCSRPGEHVGLDDLEAALFDERHTDAPRARFDLDTAQQGADGVELVRRAVQEGRPYAIAFVDGRMPPGLDGVETISRLWKADPHVQAIICSAYSDHSWAQISEALGQSDGLLILRKPFDPIEVLQLAHAMGRKWLLSRQVRRRLDDLEAAVRGRTEDLERTNQRLREEVAERQRAEDELKHLAMHDALTGLPNRVLLHDRLTQALARAPRHHSTVAVMLLDLDQFKDVNDTLGHATGDALLREVATRLAGCVRACDTVARMGGDEFVLVLEDLGEPEDASVVAERAIRALGEPVDVHGRLVRTSPSIGIARFPSDCNDIEGLLKSADLAMYQAKRAGRNTYRYFEPAMRADSLERVRIKDDLHGALARDELVLWYQPLYDLGTGAVTAVEALLRWQHPELGLIPPMRFIPLAERSGLIGDIGAWVLREACRHRSEWRRNGSEDVAVAVNVSPRQLERAGFVESVRRVLDETRVPAHRLELELTETAAMQDVAQSRGVLEELASIGVRLVIDDFGAGYSSLMRLKQMPIHAIKIDRFFVRDIAFDNRDAAIVRSVVGLAHSLGLRVTAEGVETPEQLQVLQGMQWEPPGKASCDRAQGFLLGKPLPPEAVARLLQGRQAELPRQLTGT